MQSELKKIFNATSIFDTENLSKLEERYREEILLYSLATSEIKNYIKSIEIISEPNALYGKNAVTDWHMGFVFYDRLYSDKGLISEEGFKYSDIETYTVNIVRNANISTVAKRVYGIDMKPYLGYLHDYPILRDVHNFTEVWIGNRSEQYCCRINVGVQTRLLNILWPGN